MAGNRALQAISHALRLPVKAIIARVNVGRYVLQVCPRIQCHLRQPK